MTASVRFEEEARAKIPFSRVKPQAFSRALRAWLDSFPTDRLERGKRVLDCLRREDSALVADLFGLEPIPAPEVGLYALHEGDRVLAAMARRVLAQAFVSARGMRTAVDSVEFREAIDSAGLAARVPNFGHYMRETFRLKGGEIRSLVRERLDRSRIERIVMPGAMGGSAIGGGVVRMLLANQGFQTNLEVLPHYPDPTRPLRPADLALIYSYSGNSEEQLLWMEPALQAGAQVIGFAVGGRLEQMCAESGQPFVRIPGEEFNLAQPREHLPVALVLLLSLAGELQLAWRETAGRREPFDWQVWHPRIEAASRELTRLAKETYNVEAPVERSVAKRAALFLNWGVTNPDRIENILRTRDPVFWIPALYEPIGKRLENQFGECVEHPAPAKVMPEDMHNEQEAYVQQWIETVWPLGEAAGVQPPDSKAVFLRFSGPLDKRLAIRADKLFNDVLAGAPRMTFAIQDYGAEYPMLSELEALLFCDLTRAFASIFRGVTPHYVHSMDYIKHYMATVEGTPGTTGTY